MIANDDYAILRSRTWWTRVQTSTFTATSCKPRCLRLQVASIFHHSLIHTLWLSHGHAGAWISEILTGRQTQPRPRHAPLRPFQQASHNAPEEPILAPPTRAMLATAALPARLPTSPPHHPATVRRPHPSQPPRPPPRARVWPAARRARPHGGGAGAGAAGRRLQSRRPVQPRRSPAPPGRACVPLLQAVPMVHGVCSGAGRSRAAAGAAGI